MKKLTVVATILLLVGAAVAHTEDNHSQTETEIQEQDSEVWASLSGAYPSQTMSIVLVETVVVALLVFFAVRHRLQLRSK